MVNWELFRLAGYLLVLFIVLYYLTNKGVG